MMKTKYGKKVDVINPHPPQKQSGHLKRAASFHVRTINKAVLAKCQLPQVVVDAQGRAITKPASW